MDPVLKVDEAAERLRVDRKTILKLLNNGELPGRKVGRVWRILESELEAFIRGSEPANETPEP